MVTTSHATGLEKTLLTDPVPYSGPHDTDPTMKLCKGLVINYREGGASKWENRGSKTFCAPPPQDRVKLFAPPLLKGGNLLRPPISIAKTSSYRIKNTPKLFITPIQLKLFPLPPLFS